MKCIPLALEDKVTTCKVLWNVYPNFLLRNCKMLLVLDNNPIKIDLLRVDEPERIRTAVLMNPLSRFIKTAYNRVDS